MKRIAVFASGSGTNAENIARIFNEGSRLRVSLVLTNRRKAGVISRMEALGVPVMYVENRVWDEEPAEVVRILHENSIDIVVLAGFMHYVAPEIIHAYQGRILNIHPSLLPAYGGKGMYGHYVHESVVAAGEKESGVTVHLVTEEMDKGEIILQERLPLSEGETAESLEYKIHPIEYKIYPEAIIKLFLRLEAAEDNTDGSSENPVESCDRLHITDTEQETPPEHLQQSWAEALGVPVPSEPLMPPIPKEEIKADAGESASSSEPLTVTEYKDRDAGPLNLNRTHPNHPMPSTYMLWAILATIFCCLVPGIVAIVYASQVSNKYYSGDFEGAEKASQRAQIWIIAAVVTGIIFTTLYAPLSMLM